MALLLFVLFAPCLWAAPQSKIAAVARLNEDVKALEMALEQKEEKKKKQPFDGTWDPIGEMDMAGGYGSDKYFSSMPQAEEWDRLRKFAKGVYDSRTDDRCGSHSSLDAAAGCKEILACDTSRCDTASGNKVMVPYKVFKVEPFEFANGVDCVVSFKGTNPGHASDLVTDGIEVGSTGRSGFFKTERIKNAVVSLFMQDTLRDKCKGIIATGHSLGGCTALNAAVYGGVRAFTFAGPGPSRGGANKVHALAQMAVETSGTLYTGSDTIAFAGKHIGDYVCNRGDGRDPVHKQANSDDMDQLNTRGAGVEAIGRNALASHSAVIEEPIKAPCPCFSSMDSMAIGAGNGEFDQVGGSFASKNVWGAHYFGHNGEDVEWSTN